MSKDTYVKIRSKAFYKMALALADLQLLSLAALTKTSAGGTLPKG